MSKLHKLRRVIQRFDWRQTLCGRHCHSHSSSGCLRSSSKAAVRDRRRASTSLRLTTRAVQLGLGSRTCRQYFGLRLERPRKDRFYKEELLASVSQTINFARAPLIEKSFDWISPYKLDDGDCAAGACFHKLQYDYHEIVAAASTPIEMNRWSRARLRRATG